MSRATHWCFTLNNPTSPLNLDGNPDIRYAIWQKEKGENGTEHYQGYIEFNGQHRLAFCKNILPQAHFEPRKGTREQARDYCRKEDTRIEGPWEVGEWKRGGQGARSDLLEVANAIKEQKTEKEIFEDFPVAYLKFAKGIKQAQQLIAPERKDKTEVIVVLGPTGCGKSSWVREQSPTAYWKQPDSEWWDGYNGRDDVVLDDFYGWLTFHCMLRLMDRYPLKVQNKGGQVEFNPKRLWITSNKGPDSWYRKEVTEKYDIKALYRRIDKIRYYEGKDIHEYIGEQAVFKFLNI